MKNHKKGFTLIELLVSIGIIGIVTAISLTSFSQLSNSESLDKETTNVISYIDKAKNDAINSLNFQEHGIKFASSTVVVFYGKNYSASATTSIVYTLSSRDIISNVTFGNASTTVYFNKLTGEPSATGTIKIHHSDGSEKTIIIYATGFVEVQ